MVDTIWVGWVDHTSGNNTNLSIGEKQNGKGSNQVGVFGGWDCFAKFRQFCSAVQKRPGSLPLSPTDDLQLVAFLRLRFARSLKSLTFA